jgi:riboflavin kinase/FMN adenylyltransferase
MPELRFLGRLVRNLGRGTRLGFPTANLETDSTVPEGIYIGYANVNGEKLPALIFSGAPITFNEKEHRIEVYLLDFEGDLQVEELEITLIKKIRDNQKFESKELLIVQMKEDERVAREYFRRV